MGTWIASGSIIEQVVVAPPPTLPLLVAPSDVDAPSYPPGTSGFDPMPLFRLPFPSVTVASSDDFYVSLPRAIYFAGQWGSRLVNMGALGHINSASNLGDWPEGYELLRSLY